jgi:dipeptidyl aminopeptidase/acylaminoacyl peptidase
MAAMKPVRIAARDGLELPGYLTLPPGVEPRNLPAVLLVHGGPWARDTWGFDSGAQFLANRGYAVLQVNFRGSTGYGRKFWEKGFKEWGKKMQDDVSDAAAWLVKEGIADPKRIGIYGGSYGGYAALAGMAFTPDLYAAGVSFVGPSNLFTLLASFPPYWEPMRKMQYEMIGNPETEPELLKDASPLFSADKIRAPLLIAQGANDPRVKKAESDQIVEALQARGIDVPYIVKDNEGHGFSNEENRMYFYRAVERFFARHLGGRVEESEEKIPELDGTNPPPAG